jgi:hypothetical protein
VLNWLKGITFVDVPYVKGGTELKKYVRENSERVRRIEYDGRLLGLAALMDAPGGFQFLTTDTVGGLTNNVMRGSSGYIGYMESDTDSAKRGPRNKASPVEVLQSWADEQISILKAKGASLNQLYWAASNMSNLDIDPIDSIIFPVFMPNNQVNLLLIDDLLQLLKQTKIGCLKMRQSDFADTHIQPVIFDGLPTLRPLGNGNLIRMNMEMGKPKFQNSLLGCLDRLVTRRGGSLVYVIKPVPLQNHPFGPMDMVIIGSTETKDGIG